MNQEIKAQWIAALRSGEYLQNTLSLKGKRNDGRVGYCCLGVLSDLAVKAGLGHWDSRDSYVSSDGNSPMTAFPSIDVVNWSGLGDSRGTFQSPVSEDYWNLSEANDYGLSFEQIADLIEEEF